MTNEELKQLVATTLEEQTSFPDDPLEVADAILAAFREKGLAVVPIEATEATRVAATEKREWLKGFGFPEGSTDD